MLNRPAPVLPHRPAHRPRLRLRTPIVWRSATMLQVGIASPVILTHADPASAHTTARVLQGLDGSRAWSDLIDHDDLLLRLSRHGLIEDAAIPGPLTTPDRRDRAQAEADAWSGHWSAPDAHSAWARRAHARIDVMGDGRVGVAIATMLSASGVGTVRVHPGPRGTMQETVTSYDITPWGPRDAGVPRGRAIADLMEEVRIHPVPRARADAPPTLVVLAHDALGPDTALPAALADDLVRRRIPHLPVIASDTRVQIGPWFLAPGDPCARCLDLHRSDADPAWPAVAAHLARPRGRDSAAVPVVTAALAGAHAALTVIAYLDSGTYSPGTCEMVHGTDASRTRFDVHPQCGCDGRTIPLDLDASPSAAPGVGYPSMAHARRHSRSAARPPRGTPAPTP